MRADKPARSNLTDDGRYSCGITGTGAANPTKRYGPGIAVTRTAQGVYKYSFSNHLGILRGFKYGLGADTPSAVKGYTVTRDTYTPPASGVNAFVELSVWDSTFAAVDLAALQYLDVEFEFTASQVDGST